MKKKFSSFLAIASIIALIGCEDKTSAGNTENVIPKPTSSKVSSAKKLKPIEKPKSMPQKEWNERVISAVEEIKANPSFLSFINESMDPVIREAARIYKSRNEGEK